MTYEDDTDAIVHSETNVHCCLFRKVLIFVDFHSGPIWGKSCPITSFSKFLMNLLCRQSQNLCPKNAKPVFTGCHGRVFMLIRAVSFAFRVSTMLIFRSDEFTLILFSETPKNCLFPHLPIFPVLVYLEIYFSFWFLYRGTN